MSQVADFLGAWRGERLPSLHCEFVYYFGLADDVMSTSHDVHTFGKAFSLAPKSRYFVDGNTFTRVSIGATYIWYLKLG